MNKKIIKLILVLLLMINLSACSLNDKKEDNNDNQNNPVVDRNDNKSDDKFSDEVVEIDKNSKLGQMFDELNKYGKEIYDKNEYTKYKTKDNMYFASLSDLGTLYDISIFVGEDGTVCNKDDSGIYFRSSYNEDELPYIPILIGCSKEESK